MEAVEKLRWRDRAYSVAVAAPTNAVPLLDRHQHRAEGGSMRIFEAIGASVGNQATVQIDPQHHRIEVIHHV